eukprot:scaffold75675_cov62-Phaeocystis_antarctica.AAC.4
MPGGRDGVRRRRERQRPTQDQSRLPHARGARRARATLPAPRRRRGRRRGAHTTLIPGHVPYHHACLTTTLATIQEQALQDAALVRRELRALTRTLTLRRSLRRSEAGRGRWCGGGATLTGAEDRWTARVRTLEMAALSICVACLEGWESGYAATPACRRIVERKM